MDRSIIIREAQSSDSLAIAKVHIAAWQSTYQGIIPRAYLDSLNLEQRSKGWNNILSQKEARRNIFVALKNQKIIGFASWGPNRDASFAHTGEIYALYLLREHQGLAIGKQLFKKAANLLLQSSLHSMLVWVLADNPTCGFYQHMGGTPVGVKIDTIGGKELLEIAYGWEDITSIDHT